MLLKHYMNQPQVIFQDYSFPTIPLVTSGPVTNHCFPLHAHSRKPKVFHLLLLNCRTVCLKQFEQPLALAQSKPACKTHLISFACSLAPYNHCHPLTFTVFIVFILSSYIVLSFIYLFSNLKPRA